MNLARPVTMLAGTLALTTAMTWTTPTLAQDEGEGQRDNVRSENQDPGQGRGGRGGDAGRRGGRGGDFGGRGGGGGFGGGRGGTFGGRGMGEVMRPEFLRRDVTFFQQQLDLASEQTMIVETLILDYTDSYEAAVADSQEAMQALRPQRTDEQRERAQGMFDTFRELRDARQAIQDATPEGGEPDADALAAISEKMDAARSEMREIFPRPTDEERTEQRRAQAEIEKELRAMRAELRRELLSDVQSILAPDQLETWPVFERALRRMKSLPNGQLTAESTDLFVVLREQNLRDADRETIAETLELYEYELDGALVARDRFLEESRSELTEATIAGDSNLALRVYEQQVQRHTAVRDAGYQYAELLAIEMAEQLSAETADAFISNYNGRAFSRIFATTATQRAFEQAKTFDLETEILDAVVELEGLYLQELATANEKLVTTTIRAEPDQLNDRMQRRLDRSSNPGQPGQGRFRRRGVDTDSPIAEAQQAKRDLDERYRERLEALLTAEQIEELPRVRRRGARGADDGGRGGRGGADGQDREARRAEFMQRFDTDGDGEISESERDAIRQQFGGGRGGRGDGGGRGGRGGGQDGGTDG